MIPRRDAICLLLLWALATGYNITKPYIVDDGAHLLIAQWIAAHPLHPMRGMLNWTGTPKPISATNQPHLYFYLLAGWGSTFGWSEPAMHALQSLFTLGCLLLMYFLARRLAPGRAQFLTAMLGLNPAFIVEQNLMVDVPLLCVWLGFFLTLAEERFVLAGCVCAAALLIKYTSLVLLPLPVLAPWLAGRPKRAIVIAIPLAALAAWSAFNLWDYGSVHLLTGFHAAAHTYPTRVSHFAAALRIRDSAVTWLVGMGALSPFGIMLLRGPAAYAALAGGFACLVLGVDAGAIPLPWAGGALWWGFMLSGVALLPLLRLPAPALRPIWLAAICTSLFCITAAPFIAARHILLILPALSLLAAQRREFSPAAKLFGLGMSAVLSIGLGMSDYQHGLF